MDIYTPRTGAEGLPRFLLNRCGIDLAAGLLLLVVVPVLLVRWGWLSLEPRK
jgi:hypothetical protein